MVYQSNERSPNQQIIVVRLSTTMKILAELPGVALEKRHPLLTPCTTQSNNDRTILKALTPCTTQSNNDRTILKALTPCTTQSNNDRTMLMAQTTSWSKLIINVMLQNSCTAAGFTKRLYRTKELLWTVDVDNVTRNNRSKYA